MGFRSGGDGTGISIPPRIALAVSGALMFIAFAIVGVTFGRWVSR